MSGQCMNSPLCVSSMQDLHLVQTVQKGTQRAVCVLCAHHKYCYSYQLWSFHELHDKQIGCTRNNGNDRVISNTTLPLLFTSPSFHTQIAFRVNQLYECAKWRVCTCARRRDKDGTCYSITESTIQPFPLTRVQQVQNYSHNPLKITGYSFRFFLKHWFDAGFQEGVADGEGVPSVNTTSPSFHDPPCDVTLPRWGPERCGCIQILISYLNHLNEIHSHNSL